MASKNIIASSYLLILDHLELELLQLHLVHVKINTNKRLRPVDSTNKVPITEPILTDWELRTNQMLNITRFLL
jgi:hypothetical protein